MKKKLFGSLASYVMINKILLISICSFCLFVFSTPVPLQADAITLTSATRSVYAYIMAADEVTGQALEDTASDTSFAYGTYNKSAVASAGYSSAFANQNTTLNSSDTFLEAYGSMLAGFDWPTYTISGEFASSIVFTFTTTVPTQYNLQIEDPLNGFLGLGYNTLRLDSLVTNVLNLDSDYGTYTGTLDAGTYRFELSGNYFCTNVDFDFKVSTPIPTPEPTVALLLGSGLLSLFGIRRKIRK